MADRFTDVRFEG